MPNFILETYVTRLSSDDLDGVVQRLKHAIHGDPIAYVRSYFVPEDDLCMHVFVAESAAEVRSVADRAGVEPERIVRSVGERIETTTRRDT